MTHPSAHTVCAASPRLNSALPVGSPSLIPNMHAARSIEAIRGLGQKREQLVGLVTRQLCTGLDGLLSPSHVGHPSTLPGPYLGTVGITHAYGLIGYITSHYVLITEDKADELLTSPTTQSRYKAQDEYLKPFDISLSISLDHHIQTSCFIHSTAS